MKSIFYRDYIVEITKKGTQIGWTTKIDDKKYGQLTNFDMSISKDSYGELYAIIMLNACESINAILDSR